MADLEHHALKRDRRFLVRLVLFLLVGAGFGAFLYAKLTSTEVGTCAADAFRGSGGSVERPGPTEPAGSRP